MPETQFLISGYDGGVSGSTTTTAVNYNNRQCFAGFLRNGEYYLPYTTWNGAARFATAAARQYLLGLVTDNTLEPSRIVSFMSADQGVNVFAFDGTAVRQYVANMDNFVMPIAFLSELVSSVDLPAPITKEVDDVLQLYRAEDSKLIGTVPSSIAEPAQNRVTTDNYYEFTQTVTFALKNTDDSFPFPDGTPFTKEITWRVPREGRTYWQYDGSMPPSNFHGVDHLDFVHIMGELLPSPSIRRVKIVNNYFDPLVAYGSIHYESFERSYLISVGEHMFNFKPDELTEATADATFVS